MGAGWLGANGAVGPALGCATGLPLVAIAGAFSLL
jgi:hypothetical protein